MTINDAFSRIKHAINRAPRNAYAAELHLQVIKYAEQLEAVSGKDFCEGVGLGNAWGSEFAKMRKISARLRNAGLDPNKL